MYVGRIEKLLAYYTLVPMCIINSIGKVTRANKRIADVFKYDGIIDGDIFALTGIKLPEIVIAAKEGTALYLKRNDKAFRILCGFIGEGENASVMMSFIDITSFENLKDLYNEEKPCIALINVDNLEELTPSGKEENELEISTEIDKLIRNWSAGMGAAVSRYKDHMYEMLLTQKNYKQLVVKKFSILDDVRAVETNMDFPVTLSIGIGIGGKTIAESEDYAQDALNLALGRGGDQVVVRNVKNFEYYGGKSQSVEKGYKGKSRIIAHALKLLMTQSNRIFIMGHSNPDMDSFGAALGIYRVAKSIGKEAYIILNSYNNTLEDIVQDAKSLEQYEFLTSEKALALADGSSLGVVVDTHRPILVESLELLEKINRTVVIDHHRRTEGDLPNVLLSYMESYASSASELVSEIVQYACEKKALTKLEADALLAGIMVDTNRFAVKAGVRTFEAASWLRRAGADLENVRRYFQADVESFRLRAMCIANAQFFDNGVAMAVCPGENPDAQIVNSQVADELLTIKGIKASFVAGRNMKGQTVVSARSLGDMNVQLIMEEFGGGGHFNTAGAQSDLTPEQLLIKIRETLEKTFRENFTIGG
ncbi:putative bifunctional signaling protein/50S ribosomal protein L9 [uncultured Eubacterium sp.]|uniref:DHH family phosphoesterase n=1 Tax=Brotomerdimonas butyrica TaxID=2981721 RepID=UPI0008221C35|nr:DHH family phosphoesterase [Brotomerdimonas butyrica]MCU6755764.1 DHH family phosphoesterase [Brotomerdimonas butyrica]SCH47335.1 putative bifunctional signaling protein/50S ribosomal protein L9 [uncultured Eubacterium sp.]